MNKKFGDLVREMAIYRSSSFLDRPRKTFIVCSGLGLIHEEIKNTFNLGNAWYLSVRNLLSSHLLSKNLKIKI
jgi:hypothetical protein